MLKTRLTSKGQVTIPAAVRHKLNIQPGDDLLFEINPDGEIKVRALKRKRLTELYASLPVQRPYPGKAKVREEAAGELSRQILRRGKEK